MFHKSLFTFFLSFAFIYLYGQDTKNLYLRISIPRGSGLASIGYDIYEIKNDSFYLFYKPMLATFEEAELKEKTHLKKERLIEFRKLIMETDSFENCVNIWSMMGSPRFFIYCSDGKKELKGFIANIYREKIFKYIDWLNIASPTGKIIIYNKEELIKREQKYWED